MDRLVAGKEYWPVPTDTDIRLRSMLDANQRDREQMCRAILAVDPHYSDGRPRHPAGGPDGGRDIEAVFNGALVAYGAVGFQNGANDSNEQKKRVKEKFSSDLASAHAAKPDLEVFAFLTNLHLTTSEQLAMKEEARQSGVEHCDVLDRERLRIELDSPSGFFIRFQYLAIPMSDAEQASFLARYGERIQEVVSTGFQRIERTLNRILFLQEAADVLDSIFVRFQLKEVYASHEIGHFRAFVHIALRAIKHDILTIIFGSSDKSNRFRTDLDGDLKQQSSGIGHGIGTGQWEQHVRLPSVLDLDKENRSDSDLESGSRRRASDEELNMTAVGSGSSIGMDSVPSINTYYSHDDILIRFRPRLQLRDLNNCMFVPLLNSSLAEKLHSIQVSANGYRLLMIGPDDFIIDDSQSGTPVCDAFTPDELSDAWVRIRPSDGWSTFYLRFDSTTPRRMYSHEEISDAPTPKAG